MEIFPDPMPVVGAGEYHQPPLQPLILAPIVQPTARELQDTIQTNLKELHLKLSDQISELKEFLPREKLNEERRRSMAGNPVVCINAILARFSPQNTGLPMANPVDQLDMKVQELQSENNRLKSDRDAIHKENERQRELVESLRRNFGQAETQRRNLVEQNTKLRNIIIKSGNSDSEPLDQVVIKLFCELRDQIVKIVHKQYGKLFADKLVKMNNPLWDGQKVFYSQLKELPESARRYRARAKIFELLFEDILNVPCFGLDETMEDCLGNFEAALISSDQGNGREVVEWRRRTVECAGWVGGRSPKATNTAKYIRSFMEPLLPSPPNYKLHDPSIQQLCDDAYHLALILRKSKANYKFEVPKERLTITDTVESEISVQDFDGPQAKLTGSRIHLTIFGALVKFSEPLGERHVLEKAFVICRR